MEMSSASFLLQKIRARVLSDLQKGRQRRVELIRICALKSHDADTARCQILEQLGNLGNPTAAPARSRIIGLPTVNSCSHLSNCTNHCLIGSEGVRTNAMKERPRNRMDSCG